MINIKEAAVYCGTYRKYNNCSLAGAWLNLADYSDKKQFMKACYELHADEEDPELMFQDYENIPEGLVGESWISEKVWDLMTFTIDYEIVEAYCSLFLSGRLDDEDLSDLEDKITERYVGHFDSVYDFGYAMVHEWGSLEIPESLEYYFDYERYGRDCSYDFYDKNGYYFWAN